ncbi:MAG: CBS domain-containing protein [Geobacteraceae bacterium]|nr:CBS domain-containing protein [Geobacteraceae bacterium]
MEVITTHVNADFDCLGAMIAARKIYPEALMVFSGSQEKGVRNFLSKSDLTFTRLKDINLAEISRLIIVDCQHSSRIGSFSTILNNEGLEVHIYDHHPDMAGNIQASGGVIRSSGSTSSILSIILKSNELHLTPEEATAILLGIYEDTGNLTYPGTSTEDFISAAWLLEKGAQLSAVSDFLTTELNADQISLLNDLLHSMKRIVIGGLDICIASATLDSYISDIASLAQIMRDMESIETLFMVVGMGSRVHIVARSRGTGVNVGEFLQHFGGGGHPSAGSATIKDFTVIQVIRRIENLLLSALHSGRAVSSIMSSQVKTISADSTIAEARSLLTRYNINAMPVLDVYRMVGVISRRIVEKALYHKLDQSPVTDYMHTDFVRLTPDTSILEVKEYLTGEGHRFAPVFCCDTLVGVVTRTDLFRYLNSVERRNDPEESQSDIGQDIVTKIRHSLPHKVFETLRSLGRVGDELGLKVYAVGGFVRDLIIGQPNSDIDVTVEGDGILFAKTFASEAGCRIKSHMKFGTATIIFPDHSKVDVASTRLEYYDSPGVLPTVERSSLKMDLYRRDFTINTLAVALFSESFGRLIDFYSARKDLKEKSIRVLHNLSFVEDPTRVFRAIRFEQRLGFKMATHTENLIKNSIRMNFLDKLCGRRLLNELIHIFEENEPHLAVERIGSLGALKYIHRSLVDVNSIVPIFKESYQVVSWFELLYHKQPFEKWIIYLLALCTNLSSDEFVETCIRLDIPPKIINRYFEAKVDGVKALEKIRAGMYRKNRSLLPSEVCHLLRELPIEILLHLMARTDEDTRRQFSIYITNLSMVQRIVDGNDLAKLGIKPGPVYKEILDAVLDARLDGMVETRADELELVNRLTTI